ncbi:right-handed parallel beta-helix repeat-containing protein [Sphingobium sp.]|uniref:right-handed parallel beta-helix repeat-containing protein n=1 Tax=Sphingobium sp. TaxID=1912891 RepID=UPI002B7D450A|nr:right-handed parallel beta-helix repeat-containing protein [Sphingobium sp.]HUD90834.1 right-handed parallel beta-helix repeat-containing protein [Sphingobium sp.]
MNKLLGKLLLALGIFLVAPITAAHAQATRTWVSGVGDDANPCSRTAPCKTFAGAISKTAAGGEINAIDPGGFGAVTVTKSITIRADGVEAGILASGSNGVIINAAPTDRIVLEGLDIDGGTPSVPGLDGVRILGAGEVIINDCVIRNFINPSSGAGVNINSASKVRVTIADTVINNNLYGVLIPANATNDSHLKMFDTLLVANSTAGLSVAGSGNDALISGNKFIGPKSLEILTSGKITSYGDNILTSGSAPTATLPRG